MSEIGRYYGWIIVSALTFLLAASHGLITTGITIFDPAILADLGISRGELKFRDLLQLFSAGAWALAIGFIAEKTGPRAIIYTGLGVLSGVLFAYGQVTDVRQIYLLHLLLAFCYSSCHVVIVLIIINQWFAGRKGVALGIILAGESLGGTVFPQIVLSLLDGMSWREAMQFMGLFPIVLAVLLLGVLRKNPEAYGWPKIGANTLSTGNTATAARLQAEGTSRRFRDYFFDRGALLIYLAAAATFYAGGAFISHAFLNFQDRGYAPEQAAFSLSIIFVMAFCGKLSSGFLTERFGTHRVWVISIAFLLTGTLLFGFGGDIFVWSAVVMFGLGWGGCYTITQAIISDHFAGPLLGRLAGLAVLIEGLASGGGSWITGVLYDASGSYTLPLGVMAGSCVVGLGAAVVASRRIAARAAATVPQGTV